MIGTFGSDNGKLILILLIKVIIFYVKLITIYFKLSKFQQLLIRSVREENTGFQDQSEDFLQIFFHILSNKRSRKLITGSIIRKSIESLLQLDSEKSKDPKWPLKMRFLQECPQPQIEVILIVGIQRSKGRFPSNNTIQTSQLIC